jgi:hypothetical protein
VYRTVAPLDAEPVDRDVLWLREQPPPVVLPAHHFGTPLARRVFHDRPMVQLSDRQSMTGLIRRVPGAQDGERLLRDGARHLAANVTDHQRETLAAWSLVDRFESTARGIERTFGHHAYQVPGTRRLLAEFRRAQQICQERDHERRLLISAHILAGMPLPQPHPGDQLWLEDLLDRLPLLPALLRAGQLTDEEIHAAVAYLTTAFPNAA